MNGTYIEIDMSEFKKFLGSVERAAKGDFRKELEIFLDGLGNEFLKILQDEVIEKKIIDNRELLSSFQKGKQENIWRIEEGGLVLEVGTSVNYAGFVNDGHWTNPKGVEKRFVPGYWEGDRFKHDSSAKSGIMLKQHWIEGKHYWESALRILDRNYPRFLEERLQEWLDQYFGSL